MTSGAKPAGGACAACPARDAKCVLPEPARPGQRVRLAVIGEAPGRNEVEQGRPFIGASGKMLVRGLATIGLRRQDIHWTNAILCDCKPEDQKAARKACAERLRAELAAVDPVVALPVGAWGLQSTMQASKRPQILKWRGSISETEFAPPGAPPTAVAAASRTLVLPTIHPAFVMRAPQWGPVLEGDVARVGRMLDLHDSGQRWLPPEAAPGRSTVVARTLPELRQLLARLGPTVGNDVETVGLGPVETLLVCLALSDDKLTVVIPWSRGRDGRDPWWNGEERLVAQAITAALARRTSVTHNGPAFDHIVEARYGIQVAAWDDTLLASHAFAGHLPKNLAHVVTNSGLDVGPWKQLEDRTATIERLWTYNGRDTLYTILAWLLIKGMVS